MKLRKFIKVGAVALGATLIPSQLNQPAEPIKKVTTIAKTHPIDLAEWAEQGKTLHISEQDITEQLKYGDKFMLSWPAKSVMEPDGEILVDNWKGFIAYNGKKILTWDVCEEDDKLRKSHHPVIYGTPTLMGPRTESTTVPLSRTAVQQHPLWYDNITPQTNLLDKLPKPPAGQRYHEIAPPPETEDLRDIRHCMYQLESEKLAYNVLNWQPDLIEDNSYPLSNNRLLLHMMATESSLYDKIGPHAWRVSTRQIRDETEDGLDKVTAREGSYAGMAQMGVNRDNGKLTGSITTTPLTRGRRWAGITINGLQVNSTESYLGNWHAQMVATLHTQITGYEYVDAILERSRTDFKGDPISASGAFMMAHLRGPAAARNYLLRGRDRTDGNATPVSYYYDKFQGYDDLLFRPDKNFLEKAEITVTPEGQALLDDIEFSNLQLEPLEPLPKLPQTFLERMTITPQSDSLKR